MRFLRVLLILVCPFISISHADDSGIPDIVPKGFETYQKYGALSAVNDWLKGSAFEQSDKDEVTGKVTRVESTYGRMIGYEPLRTVKLTPSTRRVYVAVKFEKGVAWMSFDCYRPATEWIIVRFDFSTKADEVVPPNILGGQ